MSKQPECLKARKLGVIFQGHLDLPCQYNTKMRIHLPPAWPVRPLSCPGRSHRQTEPCVACLQWSKAGPGEVHQPDGNKESVCQLMTSDDPALTDSLNTVLAFSFPNSVCSLNLSGPFTSKRSCIRPFCTCRIICHGRRVPAAGKPSYPIKKLWSAQTAHDKNYLKSFNNAWNENCHQIQRH